MSKQKGTNIEVLMDSMLEIWFIPMEVCYIKQTLLLYWGDLCNNNHAAL